MTKNHSTQAVDTKLVKLADALAADKELYEATLDGLEARIDANIAALEDSDIDTKIASAEEDIAELAATTLKADAAELEDLDGDIAAADAEEDALLAEDELPVAETAERLTAEDAGITE